MLAARIDRLPETDKEVLHIAAVIGKRFARGVLGRVLGRAEDEVAGPLGRLVEAQLVRPEQASAADDERFVFEHPLTQEVAYRSQLAAQRARVHARVAAVLEELHGERPDAAAALVSHHHESAGDLLSAARWARRAAERAMRSDVAETVRWWRKTGELAARLPETGETREIRVWAGIQLLNLGWRAGLTAEEATRLFESGVELARRTGDPSAVSGFLVTYGAVQGLAGRPQEAVELITEAARLAREAGDEGTELATMAALSQAQNMSGRLREAIATLDAAVALTERSPGLGSEQTGFDNHVWCLALRGSLRTETGGLALAERERAIAVAYEALELAQARRTSFIELLASVSLARVLRASGHGAPGEVTALLARGEVLVAETGAESWRALLHLERARLAADAGDAPGRERELERTRACFLAIGAARLASEADGLLGERFVP